MGEGGRFWRGGGKGSGKKKGVVVGSGDEDKMRMGGFIVCITTKICLPPQIVLPGPYKKRTP